MVRETSILPRSGLMGTSTSPRQQISLTSTTWKPDLHVTSMSHQLKLELSPWHMQTVRNLAAMQSEELKAG